MLMQSYKAVFSDIDGTLLNSRHQISLLTETAIHSVVCRKIPFIPVSARPPLAITPFVKQLNLQNPIICYSGALILDQDLKSLYSVTIDEKDLSLLENLFEQKNSLSVNYYVGVDWFSDNVNDKWVKQEEEITKIVAKPRPEKMENVHKILIMGEAEAIVVIEKQLKTAFPHLSIHRSKNEYLEIMNKAATKSNAIRFIEKMLNISSSDIVAFGDNFNDLDMLEYAGLGVAMGNSPDEIKAAAQRVTATNDEDGIALVLNDIFKLNLIAKN